MLRIRIVSASALAAIIVALTVSVAAAQSSDSAGQPLALLAGLHPPHAAKADTHAKPKHRKIARFERKHLAKHSHAVAAAEPEAPAKPTAAPNDAWPTTPQSAPDNTVATVPAATPVESAIQPAPPPPPAGQMASSAVSDTTPNVVVMNGQTVEIASPDYLNAIDRAAEDNHDASAATPVRTAFAAPVQDDASPVGSVSWIAQVLAALCGAMAAGVAAWFLIGPGPQRMYG
jgi:hypothetical protein